MRFDECKKSAPQAGQAFGFANAKWKFCAVWVCCDSGQFPKGQVNVFRTDSDAVVGGCDECPGVELDAEQAGIRGADDSIAANAASKKHD